MPSGVTYPQLNERQRDQLAHADLRIIVAAARVAAHYNVPLTLPPVRFDALAVEHRGAILRAAADALEAAADIAEQ